MVSEILIGGASRYYNTSSPADKKYGPFSSVN